MCVSHDDHMTICMLSSFVGYSCRSNREVGGVKPTVVNVANIQHQSPKELPSVETTRASAIRIPCSKSDLSAILACGKQVVSPLSRSNPELGNRIDGRLAIEKRERERTTKSKSPHSEVSLSSTSQQQASGSEACISLSSVHYTTRYEAAPNLCGSHWATEQGRISPGWQHSIQ